jgi:cytochrome c-type biogenesis protein CcmH
VSAAPGRTGVRVWLPWIALSIVVVAALAVGTLGGGEPSDEARARSLEETIRCPQCASQSVADSETPSAKGVKVVIRERIEKGNTDEEIRDFIASRYGRDVLLDPSGSGFGALVWALPVVVALVAVGGLVYRFGDWRPAGRSVTQADRDLVDEALAEDVRP